VKLNVDRLLAESPPRTAYDAWRRGDPNPLGGGCITSGLSIKLFQGWSSGDLHHAIRGFLKLDAAFLRAARRRIRGGTVSQLSATVFVGEDEELPAGLELPSLLLSSVAAAGLSWSVSVWVCRNHEGEAPSNNELQRTRPAQAMEPRR
jgi:hypothetical protein